ncbi:MAG TPA: energy transducer TonB [Pseudomonadales bacterium]
MWITWLLKYDGYPPGVVVALLLHGILMWIFLPKDFDPADQVSIEPASFVVASAVTQSPQRLRRIEQANTQRRNEEAARERQRQQERERQQQAAAEQQRQAEAQRQQQAEAERQRQAEAQRQQQAEAERQQQAERERQQQAEAERQRQAEAERQRQETAQREAAEASARAAAEAAAQQMSAENQMVAQYMAIIRDLVSAAWSRPPSARNGMVATVQLRLTPTGEIIDRQIVRPSGDPTFDRSVLQAIDRVGAFSELQDMPTPIFERNFRAINLEFSPEDLLR